MNDSIYCNKSQGTQSERDELKASLASLSLSHSEKLASLSLSHSEKLNKLEFENEGLKKSLALTTKVSCYRLVYQIYLLKLSVQYLISFSSSKILVMASCYLNKFHFQNCLELTAI